MQGTAPGKAPRRIWARLALVIAGFAVGLTLSELGLRVVEKFREREQLDFSQRYLRADARLGRVIVPNAPGHDANGFRNSTVPERADLVAIGDSQTWGMNAELNDAWPQTLGRTTGRVVYNMGVPGYGPVQYWALTTEALSFSPKVIVVGLYLGNDFYNAYRMVYGTDSARQLQLRAAPSVLFEDTIERSARERQNEVKDFVDHFGRTDPADWGLWLRGHTATGRLLDRAGFFGSGKTAWDEIDARWIQARPDQGVVYDDGVTCTVMTTSYRLSVLNLNDPRIAEGLRITIELLRRIKVEADRAGAHFLLVLIPSKESVFSVMVKSRNGGLDPIYASVEQNEAKAREAIIADCASTGIEFVDTLPALADAAIRHEQLYPPNTESHPRPQGYSVIAAAVATKLQVLRW